MGCTALVVWIGAPIAQRLIGRLATVVMAALFLLALGGALIIHEPSYSRRTRRVRLGVVFGSIGIMIMVARLGTR